MLILAINTATVTTQIALLEADGSNKAAAAGRRRAVSKADGARKKSSVSRVIWEKEWKSKFNEAEKILPAIKTALKKAGIGKYNTPGQRTSAAADSVPGIVFVVSGPGSFTGLRIGITVANAIAWAAGAGMEACTTFEYLRAAAPPAVRAKTAVMLRAGGAFVAVAGPDVKSGASAHDIIAVSSLPEYFKNNKKIKFVLADLKPEEKKKIKLPAGIKWLPETKLNSFGNAVVDQRAAARSSDYAPAAQKIIKPFYLQPPKITQSKKQVFPGAPPA